MPQAFLEYLTIFRSRVAVANVVLPLVGLMGSRQEVILRKLRQVLDERVELDLTEKQSEPVLEYLVDKQLIGPRPRRTGRYSRYVLVHEEESWRAQTSTGDSILRLPVFKTDIWFSDPRLRSTVGLPTPDNAEETLDFCSNLNVVSKVRWARTTEGQVAVGLRKLSGQQDNPFVIGLESVLLLRELLMRDGLMLSALSDVLMDCNPAFRRDDLIPDGVVGMARRAYESARALELKTDMVAQTKTFLRLIEETIRKKASRAKPRSGASPSVGPGVLEHRLSPRLEWLTDFGVLTKDGLPRNSFSYRTTPLVHELGDRLKACLKGDLSADDAALDMRRMDAEWEAARREILVDNIQDAILAAYRSIKMNIGPVPIREVCFIAAVHLDPIPHTGRLRDELLEWAQRDSNIKLAGGRYHRGPEMVRFSDKLLT
jgi:hypothetical protein